MRKTLVVAIVGALAAGAMVGGATIALAQADVIKERQENRKQTAAAMRAIKGVIDAKGPTAGAVEQAAKLKTLEAAFVKMFPAGSDKGETKALPTVWSDMAGFQAASKAVDAAYRQARRRSGLGRPGGSWPRPSPTPARPAAPATTSSAPRRTDRRRDPKERAATFGSPPFSLPEIRRGRSLGERPASCQPRDWGGWVKTKPWVWEGWASSWWLVRPPPRAGWEL